MENQNPVSEERKMKSTALPTEAESLAFLAAGYEIDQEGRPLHPYLDEIDPNKNGKGKYWNWGPNYTADPIVLTTEARPRILLIQRTDTGDLALPGGFVDADEMQDPVGAARRELEEETGLVIQNEGTLIYQGVVQDPRATTNAWPETSAYLFQIDEPLPVEAGDDAREASWHYIDKLPESLYGSHAALIQKALELRNKGPRTIEEVLSIPAEQRETHIIDAGHMAYDHYFTRYQDDHLFVKAHDASRFTDPFREAHSRAYLEKEYSLFHHLEQNKFKFIPERVALIEDSVLAMDALHPSEGWLWRAPREDAAYEQYVNDTIGAFNQLQTIEAPLKPEYHTAIKNTYATLWEEGWDSINDEQLEKIIAKIRQFSVNWSPEQYDASEGLINSLPIIRKKALKQNRNEPLFMAHNDARQSNIAWHPTKGTRLVDWSWGDVAPKDADATMFLIDLAKSNKDVTAHLDSFNLDHANTLIGFWLAHSLWETRDGSQTVREHQIASAIAAYRLQSIEA